MGVGSAGTGFRRAVGVAYAEVQVPINELRRLGQCSSWEVGKTRIQMKATCISSRPQWSSYFNAEVAADPYSRLFRLQPLTLAITIVALSAAGEDASLSVPLLL
jgi:hypothetical protein